MEQLIFEILYHLFENDDLRSTKVQGYNQIDAINTLLHHLYSLDMTLKWIIDIKVLKEV